MTMPAPTHNLLPAWAVELLQQAAQTPITRADPLARTKAIEKAIQRIKHTKPSLFKKD